MNQSKKCTAIKGLLFLALMLTGALAGAADAVNVSTVLHVSGPLLATRADGTSRILAPNSAVNPGETLITQKNGYAQIKFSDGSLLTLQPGTVLTIDKFSYDAAKPDADEIAFTLQQGGIRSNAGLLAKRSKDRVSVSTPAGLVTMENASAVIQYQPPGAGAQIAQRAFLFASMAALDASMTTTRTDAPLPAASASLLIAQLTLPPTAAKAPGLYVQVLDGLIHVTNPAGTSNFSAGQFGYTASVTKPPIMLPVNPGIQFTPPPVFSVPPTITGGNTAPKSNAVDCEVR